MQIRVRWSHIIAQTVETNYKRLEMQAILQIYLYAIHMMYIIIKSETMTGFMKLVSYMQLNVFIYIYDLEICIVFEMLNSFYLENNTSCLYVCISPLIY